MSTPSDYMRTTVSHRAQGRVIALKYDHRLAHPRARAMRLMMVWLSFCITFVIGLSAALSFAG